MTIRFGFYNVALLPDEPGCWELQQDEAIFHAPDGYEVNADMKELVAGIRAGKRVPSRWLPPGVTVNPAAEPPIARYGDGTPIYDSPIQACPKDENPIKDEHKEDAKRFVNEVAIGIIATIYDATVAATDDIRRVYPRPSLLDRAIAERVLALLS